MDFKTEKKISLDVYQSGIQTIFAKQYDNNTRYLIIEVVENGKHIDLTQLSCAVYFEAKNGKGRVFKIEGEILPEGTVSIGLTSDVLSADGRLNAEIRLLDLTTEQVISTIPFTLYVKPSVIQNSDIDRDELGILDDLIMDVKTMEIELVALDDYVNANEDVRKENEDIRLDNEVIRINNEVDRNANEDIRNSNESVRNTNESIRLSNESVRRSNESIRLSNESQRETNESQRDANEAVRNSNEQERVTSEGVRNDNESVRIENENVRLANEIYRHDLVIEMEGDIDRLDGLMATMEGYKNAAESAATYAATSEANAKTSEDNAKDSETEAKLSELNSALSESNALQSAQDAEAYAKGTREGTSVVASDPAYHDNAKYWSDFAKAIAGADVMQPASETENGLMGFVPQPVAGEQNACLRGDGTFRNPSIEIETEDDVLLFSVF